MLVGVYDVEEILKEVEREEQEKRLIQGSGEEDDENVCVSVKSKEKLEKVRESLGKNLSRDATLSSNFKSIKNEALSDICPTMALKFDLFLF